MKRAAYFIALLVVASAQLASAQFQCLSYQGTLRTGGVLVVGNHSVTFRIYNVVTGGTAIWTETIPSVAFSRGVFTVLLGDPSRTPPAPLNLLFDRTYWLGIAIDGGTELTPRVILCASPYSFNAKAVRGNTSTSNVFPIEGNVGIGTLSPGAKLDVQGAVSSRGMRTETSTVGQSGIYSLHTGAGEAVSGYSSGGTGVAGFSSGTGKGVFGFTNGSGAGVRASNSGTGPAVQATNTNGAGIPGATIRAQNQSTSSGIAGYFETRGTDATLVLENKGSGPLLKGFGNNNSIEAFRIENNGTAIVRVLQITGGADLSEQFEVTESSNPVSPEAIPPGMLVSIDAQNPGKLVISSQAYDRKVAGIISGAGGIATGMLMGQNGSAADGSTPVALAGRVYCWADASQDTIEPGDLLTTSDTPGHAMKVTDHVKSQGAIIGKAMTGLAQGKGLVLVLVTLQ